VLLDIPALHGVEWLEFEQAIGPDELEAAEQRQGVTVGPGDALLVHTGYVARTLANGPNDPKRPNQPGLHAGCLPFLRERDVAVLGSDAIHAVGLVAMGLWLIDNMELTELAAACTRLERSEFFFAMLPWRMVGVTSSATNPIALL
jgi:kynurenine formamidase